MDLFLAGCLLQYGSCSLMFAEHPARSLTLMRFSYTFQHFGKRCPAKDKKCEGICRIRRPRVRAGSQHVKGLRGLEDAVDDLVAVDEDVRARRNEDLSRGSEQRIS